MDGARKTFTNLYGCNLKTCTTIFQFPINNMYSLWLKIRAFKPYGLFKLQNLHTLLKPLVKFTMVSQLCYYFYAFQNSLKQIVPLKHNSLL